ncbi:uncharacterized protein LOC141680765 [Apium graveolens]|uniref:uncharacterized protein LOC141680765 n=1 Tax=Apium graveolens TaxID=4045 RepID=UPI003D795FE2
MRDKTPTKLLAMSKTAETNIRMVSPAPIVMVNKEKDKGKDNWKGMKKMGSKSGTAPKTSPKQALKPGGGIAKGDTCHYCKKPGHWKRNYQAFLEDLKKKKTPGASDSGIYGIEVNLSTSSSWVLDNGYGSHICINVQELQESRILAKGEVDLRVGNRVNIAALATAVFFERELLYKKNSRRTIDLGEDQYVKNIIEPVLESGQDVHQDVPALET